MRRQPKWRGLLESPAGFKGTRVEREASEEPGRSIVVLAGCRVCQLKGPSIGRQTLRWKSDPLVVSERGRAAYMGKRGSRARLFGEETPPALRGRMKVSTQLLKIAAKAKQDPKARFTSLVHILTPDFLLETWRQLNRKGASGIDGETSETFETNLEERIQGLWRRLRAGRYQAPPVRRVEIHGKMRPLGTNGRGPASPAGRCADTRGHLRARFSGVLFRLPRRT
jgi:hypothetical protein